MFIFLPFIVLCCPNLLALVVASPFNETFFTPVDVPYSWTNNDKYFPHQTIHFVDGSVARLILLKAWTESVPLVQFLGFGFGFFCRHPTTNSWYLSTIILEVSERTIVGTPQLVSSANRDYPVKENTTLKLSNNGNMFLVDIDGSLVWSTKALGMSIAGMRINRDGNVVLLDQENNTVWQSFHHPRDTLLDFFYFDLEAAFLGLDAEGCIQVCVLNLSCRAAFFKYLHNGTSNGYCYMPSNILSIIESPMLYKGHDTISYIRVPNLSSLQTSPFISAKLTIGKSTTFVIVVLLMLVTCSIIWRKKKHFLSKKIFSKHVSEMPLNFSYRDLCAATKKFSEKLGGGGFGVVFKGVLRDGTVIASHKEEIVKMIKIGIWCLNGDHTKRPLCLPWLRKFLKKLGEGGFGAVFKGALRDGTSIAVKPRRKIILDISKGLQYLHEDCRRRIAHLDVKPQNILIDNSFNAKLSYFGLSKLIDRDDSQVVTGIRGTLGYLAPEWQHPYITVKADIYSYGVVLLEVVSGRKNLDHSRPDSAVHLLNLLQRKVEQDRLLDIVDYEIEDLERHEEEIVKMIKLELWCLNGDPTKRPPMSTVVKVLDGVIELETDASHIK
ncbi:hypothetical protein GIB67_027032 [Kingdonia uniflora]|uniref:non-specific serine/threonine protein kinase n=1 Tax=Kingdonia uniflora TaxID=39325 RepID=A0A7J7P1J6_9MAGN|nr:hypothetical protein GIB67_027032 [Kingdonia uniflora]